MAFNTLNVFAVANLKPYIDGQPWFRLELADSTRRQVGSQTPLAYRFTQVNADETEIVIFEADDFGCSPLHAIDSPECVISLMGFLTLRRGDTDSDFFDDDIDVQTTYRNEHAETLSLYARDGDDECLAAVRAALDAGRDDDVIEDTEITL